MRKILIGFIGLLSCVYAQTIELAATVVSDNEKYITSRFMGYVKNLHVSEGSSVKKGELLYEIDSTEIDNKVSQAKAAISMYNAQYLTMKQNYERYKNLYDKELVSKFELEQLELGMNNLKDMVDISQSQLQEVMNQYNYLKIKAPNDSVVIRKMIKAGEMAMPGMPALILTDLDSLKIRAEVAESDLRFFTKGKKVKIEIPSFEISFDGEIEAIIPNSNPMTHKFEIKVKFAKQSNIYPGMYAKISLDRE
jgi:RND family efflux transporter MFP subunit